MKGNKKNRRVISPHEFDLQNAEKGHYWAIVLAGGEGIRMRSVIEQWLGTARPKQYCAFTGTRSMLQHTLDRASRLTNKQRVIAVIGKGHHQYLDTEERRLTGTIIEQPASRDTAAGVFVALTYIMSVKPEATVVIFPSDHFVYPEEAFLVQMKRTVCWAEQFPAFLILVGVAPESPETDYGWIQAGPPLTEGLELLAPRTVLRFQEKPSQVDAQFFFQRGDMLNTMIVAAKAKTLWELGKMYLPSLMRQFEQFRDTLAAGNPRIESKKLEKVYSQLEVANFSGELLANAHRQSLVVRLENVGWSDWGRPERVLTSLARLGLVPTFSPSACEAATA
ncbi:MAG: NTP transferase domain-containing protein [Acidobacteria bacterium]|nr:NTP transferase domain-containing protein [Acidobacteriota bacterium]